MKPSGGKSKSTKPTTPEIELDYTGDEALKRLTDMTRQVLTVPKAEIIAREKAAKSKRKHQ